MAHFEWNHVYYAIPVGIGVVAVYMGWEHYRTPKWDPASDSLVAIVRHCAPGRFRCAGRQVTETTGEEVPGSAGVCVERPTGACSDRCVVDGVSLGGIEASLARQQLCDPPASVATLVEDERSNLNLAVSEAGVCDADGFAPTELGIHQCILRSSSEPGATGAIIMTARCRSGIVQTNDRRPQLITREQAIALWCRRDTDTPTHDPLSASPSASGSTSASASQSGTPKLAPAPASSPPRAPASTASTPAPAVAPSAAPIPAPASTLPALIPASASASAK